MISLLFGLVLWSCGDDLLARAEQAYRDGRWAEAHSLYATALLDPATPRGPVLFNLGTCAYRAGQVPEAILCWRRAQLRAPHDAQIAFNIRRAEQELGLAAPVRAWHEWATPTELLGIVIMLQLAGILGFLACRRRGLRAGAGLMVLATVLPGVAAVSHACAEQPASAVVLPARIPLRLEPHAEAGSLATLPAGSLVRIVAMSERWALVEGPALRGWVDRTGIALVD